GRRGAFFGSTGVVPPARTGRANPCSKSDSRDRAVALVVAAGARARARGVAGHPRLLACAKDRLVSSVPLLLPHCLVGAARRRSHRTPDSALPALYRRCRARVAARLVLAGGGPLGGHPERRNGG